MAHPTVSAQCPACGLDPLATVLLQQDAAGRWFQVNKHPGVLAGWLHARILGRHEHASSGTEPPTVQIDACPICFGAWFDAGELDALADVHAGIEHARDPNAKATDRPCPHGHGPMEAHVLPAVMRTPVDRCARCGGIWLDGHERRKLARASTREGQGSVAEQWLRRGAIWAAQVLTHLPVEVENPARATPWIVYLALAVLLVVFLGQEHELIWTDHYGLIPGRLWHEHDVYTLFAYMFLHGSWPHLLGNGYFLFIFGDNVEHLFGRLRFAVFFVVTGVVAGLIHFIVMRKTADLVVGASGAISGVLAAYVWAFPRQRLFQVILWIQLKIPVWVYVAGWFTFQAVMGLFVRESASAVAWFAHLGGFAFGLAVTPLLLHWRRNEVAARVDIPAFGPRTRPAA